MVTRSRRAAGRRGVIAVIMAISLTLLIGVVALTADGGWMLAERRYAQATADTAALAAATDVFESWASHQDGPDEGHDPDGTARAAAQAILDAAGFTAANSTTTINISPNNYQGGEKAGQPLPAGYVEVIVQSRRARAFSAIFGGGNLSVSARSVSRGGWLFAPPIWVGDQSADGALFFPNSAGGNITIGSAVGPLNPQGGRVIVNSSSALAALNDGAGGTISAADFFFGGGHQGAFTGNVRDGQRPVPDPLRSLPVPPLPARSFSRVQFTTGSQTLDPGVYVGGISVGTPLSLANLTLNPGVYYMQGDASGGGLLFQGRGTLTGRGVLIYNAPADPSHAITIKGRGTAILSPPTIGLYKGLTIFQDRASDNVVTLDHGTQVGTNYFDITGAVYAVKALVKVTRKPGDRSTGSQFISNLLEISGSGDMAVPGNYVRQRLVGGVE